MSYIVTWVLFQLVMAPCPQKADPYGRQSTMTLSIACYDKQRVAHSRTFFTKAEVDSFIAKAPMCAEADSTRAFMGQYHSWFGGCVESITVDSTKTEAPK